METKKVFKFFMAWSLEKEEAFTENASKGWALQRYNLLYTFKKTEPKDVIYKADFRLVYRDSKENNRSTLKYMKCPVGNVSQVLQDGIIFVRK